MRRVLLALLLLLPGCRDTPADLGDDTSGGLEEVSPMDAARAFSASQPYYLQATDSGGVPAGLPDLRAATCGGCHTEIYAEWRISTHARAYGDDPQFQAELHKSRNEGGDVGWMCLNCHTPLMSQQPKLVTGLHDGKLNQPQYLDNPGFDATLQHEAVTCASCHVRDGVVLGPFGAGGAPHAVRRSEDLLTNTVCTRCHQAKAHFEELALACVFDTGSEFEAGPYAAQGFTCQSCHMPEIERPLVSEGASRKTRRHWFGGSMIPKQPHFEEELAAIRSHYPDGLAVAWIGLPNSIAAGRSSSLRFRIQNQHAGHMLPTGDPERFLVINARLRDASNRVVAERSERIGAVWEWSPQPRKISDNRLAPQEAREFDLELPALPAGTLSLELEASKWRISEQNQRYHQLEGQTVPGRIFHRASTTLAIR